MEKWRIDDFEFDYKSKEVSKNGVKYYLKTKCNKAWDGFEYLISKCDLEVTPEALIEVMDTSSRSRVIEYMGSFFKALEDIGFDTKKNFYHDDKPITKYKFKGKFINLDIEKDKQVYYQNLSNELKFKLRDNAGEKERNLWDFYVKPRFKSFHEEYNDIFAPLSQNNKLFVVGPSGRGKTTLLEGICYLSVNRFIDREVAEDSERLKDIRTSIFGDNSKNYVPVYIKAKSVKKGESKHFLRSQEKGEKIEENIFDFAVAWDELENVYKSTPVGDLLICIDAIDEIENEDDEKFFYGLLRALIATYEKACIVVSGRFFCEEMADFNFTPIKLGSFTKEDVIKSIELLNENYEIKEDKIEFIKKRLEDRTFFDFISNPYCISVALCSDCNMKNDFAKFLEHLSKNIISFRIKIGDKKQDYYNSVLKNLAWNLISQKKENVKRKEFFDILDSMVKPVRGKTEVKPFFQNDDEIDGMIEAVSRISGILDQKIVERNIIYFFQSELLMCCYAALFVIDTIENKAKDLRYEDIKKLINMETETGVDVLLLAISLSGSKTTDADVIPARILFDYMMSYSIHKKPESESYKNLIKGMGKLKSGYFGHTIFHNPRSDQNESIYKKIMADILELNKNK